MNAILYITMFYKATPHNVPLKPDISQKRYTPPVSVTQGAL